MTVLEMFGVDDAQGEEGDLHGACPKQCSVQKQPLVLFFGLTMRISNDKQQCTKSKCR